MKTTVKSLTLIVSLFIFNLSFGQSNGTGDSCSDATEIIHTENSCLNFQVQNNQIWIKFTATSNYLSLNIEHDYSLDSIILYSGTCINLNTLLNSDKKSLEYTGLVISSDYYIKIKGANSNLNLSVKSVNAYITPDCSVISFAPCNKSYNGDFALGSYDISSGPDTDCFDYTNQEVPSWVGISNLPESVQMIEDIGFPVAHLTVSGGS